jgi:hypothetical protein
LAPSFVVLLALRLHTFGPKLVLKSHIDYNKAVEQVIQEELLLNIVRRRYYEAPQFVTISNINTSMSTSAGISGGAGFGNQGTPTTGNIGGNIQLVRYADRHLSRLGRAPRSSGPHRADECPYNREDGPTPATVLIFCCH